MFVKSFASTISGINAVTITVEANISAGIGMYLVGLPDNAIKESQERIRAAFENSGLRMTGKKITVNLAPADLRKEGSAFDLPIAIAILAATSQAYTESLSRYIIMGELSLDGTVKPIKGALPIAINAAQEGFKGLILPVENAAEAAVVEGLEVIGVRTLREVLSLLEGSVEITPTKPLTDIESELATGRFDEDFSDVRGQAQVKRALEISAAGGHNVIMIGSPGSGKTMLAKRIPSILPPMSISEALETTKIHSVAGRLGAKTGLLTRRPYRSPHNISSQVALIGGGATPQPGEISLAHNGVLFLDELPEFGRNLLEVLRQPLEDKVINVSRAKYSVDYPANFILIAAMNPCPCGYFGHPTKPCVCSRASVIKYMNRISGPLMDRIDLHIQVSPLPIGEMSSTRQESSSAEIRERVVAARKTQQIRFEGSSIHTNAMMNTKMLREYAPLSEQCVRLLESAMTRFDLSARAYDRIVKVARTIADLEQSADISPLHIAEAIQYRCLDRSQWGAGFS